MGVGSLGYIVLDVSRPAAWLDLLTGVFGLEIRRQTDDGRIDLRMDEYDRRLSLQPGTADGIAALGWEVASQGELDGLAQTLRARGIEVAAGSPEHCATRGVAALYRFTEPMIGVATEIVCGPARADTPLAPARPIAGYHSSPEVGLGHVVFWVADLAATVAFYREVMGFSISDTIAWDDNDAVFLHCNPRHHTLALMAAAPGRPAGALNHIMLEARSLDDVGHGYDIVRDRGVPVMIEPGKHSNDHMQSFYLQTPSGFWMEYGYGGKVIGPDWQVAHYDAPMLWGHRMVAR